MTSTRSQDVALIGMACTYPNAVNLDTFWSCLMNGLDFLTTPDDQHSSPMSARLNLGMRESLPATTEILRKVVYDALQDAGTTPGDKILSRTILTVGLGTDRQATVSDFVEDLGLSSYTEVLVNGCLSSWTELQQGLHSLGIGNCDLLVVAAIQHCGSGDRIQRVQGINDHGNPPLMGEELAPMGQEGVSAVVFKRRDLAESDGDSAYAFLKDSVIFQSEDDLRPAYSQMGISPDQIGLLEIQCDSLLAQNVHVSGVSEADSPNHFLTGRAMASSPVVSFLGADHPCEGDSPRGDLEVLRALFGFSIDPRALRPMGTLQTKNESLGALAWLTSLMKVALCLNNKLIPPSRSSKGLVSAFESLPYFLNCEPRPWFHDASGSQRLAALHVPEGKGGMTHVILEEVPCLKTPHGVRPRPIKTDLVLDTELVVFSGMTQRDLLTSVERLQEFLDRSEAGVTLADLAYTQSRNFDAEAPYRLAMVCRHVEELKQNLSLCNTHLETPSPTFKDLKDLYFTSGHQSGKIACLFPGLAFPGLLGPYVDHLFELCLCFPEVRSVFDQVDYPGGYVKEGTPINQVFFPPVTFPEAKRKRLRERLGLPGFYNNVATMTASQDTNLCHFGVTVANCASWSLIDKLGLSVDMMFGQSEGELSALCVAGVLEFSEIIDVHLQYRLLPEHLANSGRLGLVSMDSESLASFLQRYPNVATAIHLTPKMQLIGGESDEVAGLLSELRKIGVLTIGVPFPAMHTNRFTHLRSYFSSGIEGISIHSPWVPVYSGITGVVYPNDPDAIRQTILANIDRPVLFWQTIRNMHENGARIFLQIGGGGSILNAFAKEALDGEDVLGVSLDVDYRSAITQLHHFCAVLLANGVALNLGHLYEHRSLKLLELPLDEGKRLAGSRMGQPQVAQSVRGSLPDPVVSYREPRMPFMGPVLHFVPNQELVIERVLDLWEDRFLAHHLYVNAEGVKPISECLPFLPMTVGMEMMAEVGSCLAPGRGLIGFEEVLATRQIELVDAETLLLRISARLHHDDLVTGISKIFVSVYTAGLDTPALEGFALFGSTYHVNLDLHFSLPENLQQHSLTPGQVYQYGHLFHGPIFQCLSGRIFLAARAVIGELVVLGKNDLFQSIREPTLLIDPTELDGVGQLIGLWAKNQGGCAFPIGIQKLELYCPTPPLGTQVSVHCEIVEYSSRFLVANVEVQDGAGHVWMRIQGWRDWVFHWPRHNTDFRRQPTRHFLSHEMDLACLGDGVVQWVEKEDLLDCKLDHMARLYLTGDEMKWFHGLDKMPTRQMQWLLGRMAAKDALRRWLAGKQEHDEMLHPAAYMIENDEKGRPFVQNLPGFAVPPQISIAHSHDRAIALVHSDPVGIDLERIQEHAGRLLEVVPTVGEGALLATVSEGELNAWITRLWCAKEAVGKVLGMGATDAPQRFEATHFAPDGAVTIVHHSSGCCLKVETLVDGEFVIAYTTTTLGRPERGQPSPPSQLFSQSA